MDLDYFLRYMPGMVGELARALNTNLEYNHPEIAIPTALAFASFLKSGKIKASGVTPNLYCLVLASSGAGKTTCQLHIEQLIRESKLSQHLMGNPGSDAGVLKALAEQPKRLLMWDEIGHALQELSSNNSASYRKRLLKIFLELYSRNGRVFIGDELKTEERVDIQAPYFTLLGSSTKNRVFNALTDDFGHDGTLPRFLSFFEVTDEKENYSQLEFDADFFKGWISDWVNYNTSPTEPLGDIAKALKLLSQPSEIFLFPPLEHKGDVMVAPEGFLFSLSNSVELDSCIKNKISKSNDFEKVFWRRAREIFTKICLCLWEPGEVLNFNFCKNFVFAQIEESLRQYQDKLGLISQRVREKEKFSRLIKTGESISKSELTRRAQHLNMSRQDKKEALDELLEIGKWEEILTQKEGSFKKTVTYRAL